MSNYKRLGDYIHLVDKRNKNLAVINFLGINITKNFMPSVANVLGTRKKINAQLKDSIKPLFPGGVVENSEKEDAL